MTFQDSSGVDITEFDLTPIDGSTGTGRVLGYYVDSTATINVEDDPVLPKTSVKQKIRDIAQYLVETNAPEVVIAIHGYGTQQEDAKRRFCKIHKFANSICEAKASVFLGYRWPSEKPTGDPAIPEDGNFFVKLRSAFQSLPILPVRIFGIGLVLSLITAGLLLVDNDLNWLFTPILFLAAIAFSTLLTLILLRLATYFRDNYRATNYAVLDLVELLRQLDQAVYEVKFLETVKGEKIPDALLQEMGINLDQWDRLSLSEKKAYWFGIQVNWEQKFNLEKRYEVETVPQIKRIKLSFIGHSMGCFVVTNTLRILSDVFDPNSINQNPPAKIGRVFCLERLVLVAPDIPTEAIRTGRSNFLKSSLRRCEEAYVFCNEGDLALRLASTAANYFSFPSRTRSSGYRLGNLSAKRFANEGDRTSHILKDSNYGIINLKEDEEKTFVESPYDWLEIRASDQEHQTLSEIKHLKKLSQVRDLSPPPETAPPEKTTPISDLFTYFDCTDYVDFQDEPAQVARRTQPQGVVSYALRRSALNFVNYVSLSFAYFLGLPRSINVHGGYFNGVFSQEMIYKLAFLGFQGLLASLQSSEECTSVSELTPEKRQKLLQVLSEKCQQQGIQVVLAPIRYSRDVLGVNPRE
ncbi:alpha/beta hydrolase [Kovacikia minuta CCNUW1]|uniref:alpha/beta hydrolase n=1 Tax=Kovacikia minuta TaxID=2931930 RepID=UPI001CC904FD|nr:alpha/beta hydrolase [Kovacikia minuta]UBF24520.1 alpha/beta hydrolase [Kovacikia minuta CCNUW1]